MSGTVGVAPISPNALDTGNFQDFQALGSITPVQMRQFVDSATGYSVTTQTSSYTFAATDRGTIVRYNSGSAGAFTVPNNSAVAFPVGVVIGFRQVSTGALTLTAASGVTINTPSTFSIVQWATGFIHQEQPNIWVVMS